MRNLVILAKPWRANIEDGIKMPPFRFMGAFSPILRIFAVSNYLMLGEYALDVHIQRHIYDQRDGKQSYGHCGDYIDLGTHRLEVFK